MQILSKFLGEGPYPVDLGSTQQENGLAVHCNNNLCVVHAKKPIPYQDQSHSHAHDSYEFVISFDDAPRLKADKKEFALPARMIAATNPEQYHGPAEPLEKKRLMAVQIDRLFLQDLSSAVFNRKALFFRTNPQLFGASLGNLLQLFMDENTAKQKGHEFILDSLSMQIAIHILRFLDNNAGMPVPALATEHRSIKRVMDYIREKYDSDFALDDVAREVGLSKYYLARVFKEQTGKTLWRYLRDYKIEKAKELLRGKKHSVTEVCFLCGFHNHSYFTRCFLQEVGCTPSQYKSNFEA